jgi:hypothetical protein
MRQWLTANAALVNLFFSFVVAVATAVYAKLTFELVRETRWMRRAQTEPKVLITIHPSEIWINLILITIKNIGPGPALSLKFTVENDLDLDARRKLSELGMIKHGVRRLAPQQSLTTFLTSMVDSIHKDAKWEEKHAMVRCSYKSESGESYQDAFDIGFEHLMGMMTVGNPPLPDIAKALEKMESLMRRTVGPSGRVQVDTYDRRDRRAEDVQRDAYIERAMQRRAERVAKASTDSETNVETA